MNPLHSFAPFDSNQKTMTSASGKRPPDEAHGPREKTIRPQQRSEAGERGEKKVHGHAALTGRAGTALIQKIQPFLACDARHVPGWCK